MSCGPGRWPIGEPFPAVARDKDLMRVLGIGRTRFYLRKRAGEFAFLELDPQPQDSATLYSGALISEWVSGGRVKIRLARSA